jgi:hypothetical protein
MPGVNVCLSLAFSPAKGHRVPTNQAIHRSPGHFSKHRQDQRAVTVLKAPFKRDIAALIISCPIGEGISINEAGKKFLKWILDGDSPYGLPCR